jgi:hypothetical protein
MSDKTNNTGVDNSGNQNSGELNSGYWNSGDLNSGDWNSGDLNSGDYNSGMFNTDEPNIRMFNKDTGVKRGDIFLPSFIDFPLNKWVKKEDMTKQEEIDNEDFYTMGGYLKTYDYKDAFRKAWDDASDEDKELLFALPNFDAKIFKEISGIDVNETEKVATVCVEISRDLAKSLGLIK